MPAVYDKPTTDFVTRWDRLRDAELLRRLRLADEELARESAKKLSQPRAVPSPPPIVCWLAADCL